MALNRLENAQICLLADMLKRVCARKWHVKLAILFPRGLLVDNVDRTLQVNIRGMLHFRERLGNHLMCVESTD